MPELKELEKAALSLAAINAMCDPDYLHKKKLGRRVARMFRLTDCITIYEMEVKPYDMEE